MVSQSTRATCLNPGLDVRNQMATGGGWHWSAVALSVAGLMAPSGRCFFNKARASPFLCPAVLDPAARSRSRQEGCLRTGPLQDETSAQQSDRLTMDAQPASASTIRADRRRYGDPLHEQPIRQRRQRAAANRNSPARSRASLLGLFFCSCASYMRNRKLSFAQSQVFGSRVQVHIPMASGRPAQPKP